MRSAENASDAAALCENLITGLTRLVFCAQLHNSNDEQLNKPPNDVHEPYDAGRAGPRLLLLMDHSPDVIQFIGQHGVVEGVSSAITTLAGYDPREVVGLHYTALLHPDDWATAANAFEQLLDHGYAGPIRIRYRHKDGSWRTIEATGRNLLGDPAARALLVITHDLTDQIHAEQLLSKANAELHSLSQQLISAHESERAHFARELHDDIGQLLFSLGLSMAAKPRSAGGVASLEEIDYWRKMVQQTLEHVQRLALDCVLPNWINSGWSPRWPRTSIGSARASAVRYAWMPMAISAGFHRMWRSPATASFRRRW